MRTYYEEEINPILSENIKDSKTGLAIEPLWKNWLNLLSWNCTVHYFYGIANRKLESLNKKEVL